MNRLYSESGYLLMRNFLSDDEVLTLHNVVAEFHRLWQKANASYYAQTALNSAYLTNREYLNDKQRQVLFDFIGSEKVMSIVNKLIPIQPCFLNTQLFFNPVNTNQNNYWHRDPQYHLTIEQQKSAILSSEVIHFRLPLLDEPGIELVPGTHKRWDSTEELNVRLEQEGHKNNEPLSQGKVIKLDAGDLLIFSANMIHRGLYGLDRLAFDILFCQPDPSVIHFVSNDALPSAEALTSLEDSAAFDNTIKLKSI
ncbi:phytanoyl-CoA dioxygenase family protein [Colwellia psychrerythraea]|uniref:Phytanoyl-CoA dioxygenase n=1 Tax=Colwellia psychrerythraea TaxID=28229 RepID=A0A099KDS9_COLPS|nr:phytanoyl-CoA dioxygenase family protein [Colwellia psychrerythraea]KGJ88919.1 Phytanoyl-CoA dioxygenase [Colwellia psychrerythraea]